MENLSASRYDDAFHRRVSSGEMNVPGYCHHQIYRRSRESIYVPICVLTFLLPKDILSTVSQSLSSFWAHTWSTKEMVYMVMNLLTIITVTVILWKLSMNPLVASHGEFVFRKANETVSLTSFPKISWFNVCNAAINLTSVAWHKFVVHVSA